jgi:hypothetical protein
LFLSYSEFPFNTHAPSLAVNAANIAPNELLGMEKLGVSNGTEALQRVKQSHTGRIEDVRDVAIVHYMDKDRIDSLPIKGDLHYYV